MLLNQGQREPSVFAAWSVDSPSLLQMRGNPCDYKMHEQSQVPSGDLKKIKDVCKN